MAPGRLLRAILPKPVKTEEALKILRNEAEKYKPFFQKDYQSTVSSWTGAKPRFIGRVFVDPWEVKITMSVVHGEGGDKWRWLSYGTKAHVIRAKKKGRLAFRTGGSPKTYPGRLWSTGGTPASGPWVRPVQVMHPGIKAREWDKLIKDKNEKPFTQWMMVAMQKAVKSTGHSTK